MKRAKLNFLVDAMAFVMFVCLLSTGFLLRYQLPPLSGGMEGVGHGRGALERQISLLWGWTRHEWGAIHFWIACALMAVLAFHLFLHWRWIVCMVQGKQTNASGGRLALGVVGLIAVVLLAAAPLMSPSESMPRRQLQEERTQTDATTDQGSLP
jgi:hypothetical protein